jgi:hypothetical protein
MKKPTRKPLLRTCPHCDGSGQLQLTGIHADTWHLLKNHGPISGAALAEIDGCQATAMNNRLVMLEEMGLARSERYGRLRLFAVCLGG